MDKEMGVAAGAAPLPSIHETIFESADRAEARWANYCVIEVMIRNKHVDEFVRDKEAQIARMQDALQSIWQYGADTLSGRVDGGPDDRKWQRDAVLEMTRRAAPFTSTRRTETGE